MPEWLRLYRDRVLLEAETANYTDEDVWMWTLSVAAEYLRVCPRLHTPMDMPSREDMMAFLRGLK